MLDRPWVQRIEDVRFYCEQEPQLRQEKEKKLEQNPRSTTPCRVCIAAAHAAAQVRYSNTKECEKAASSYALF